MFRIDTSRAVAVRPAAGAAGSPGYFGAGDPTTGFLPTQFSPDWCNDVQENLMAVLADGGITGVKGADGDINLRDAIRAIIGGRTRLRLAANLDLYVATSGNDSNPGTVGSPFRNIQTAINYVYDRLDLNGYNVTIHIAAGTYTEVLQIRYPPVGAAPVGTPITLIGDTTTPANVVITTSDANSNVISVAFGAAANLKGLKLVHTAVVGYAALLGVTGGSWASISAIEFGASPYDQMAASSGGVIASLASDWQRTDAAAYKIVGGAQTHARVYSGGGITCTNSTITLTGTPGFGTALAVAGQGGTLWFNGCTFSGSATGKRYVADAFGLINTAGGGASFLPGNVAGSVDVLGKYT